MNRKLRPLAASMLFALVPLAAAQVTSPPPPTTPAPTTTAVTLGVPANRLVNLFTGFLGSRENAIALVTALRNGTNATLVTTATCAAPCTTPPTGTSTTIEVATRPMGWGNVRHALALAQYSLAQAGITHPTSAQLAAALNGGTVTTTSGQSLELNGILTQRAGGMGWGQIAHAEGTTMGRVNHGLKPFNAVTTPPTTSPMSPVPPTNLAQPKASPGIVTAGGSATLSTPGRGIVTGNGGGAVAGAQGRGNGHGNAHGHGGSSAASGAGMTTAANSAASTTVTTAHGAGNGNGNGRGGGNGNGHGNGKGK